MNDVLDHDFEASIRAALADDAGRAPQPTDWAGPRTTTNTNAPAGSSRRWVSVAAAIIVVAAVGALVWTMVRSDGPTTIDTAPTTPTTTPVDLSPAAWTTTIGPSIEPRAAFVSVPTDSGWFVWGGWTMGPDGVEVSAQDGAYLDATTSTWTTLPAAPIANNLVAATGVWTGTEVIVVVAYDEPQIAAFNPETFQWRQVPVSDDLLAAWPRGDDGGHFALGFQRFAAGRLQIFAPVTENGRPVLLEVDPATGDGTAAPEPPITADDLISGVTASNDRLFVVEAGQRNSDSACSDQSTPMHVFDPTAGTWNTVFLPYEHWQPAIVTWTEAGMLAAGGRMCDTGQTVRTTSLFDPATSTWAQMADMNADLPFVLDLPVVSDGRVIAIGEAGTPIVYDLANDAWWTGPRLYADSDVGDIALAAIPDGITTWSASPWEPSTDGSFSCCTPNPDVLTVAVPADIPHDTTVHPTPIQPPVSTVVDPACAIGAYTVVQGDTPFAVATKFDLTVDELNRANVDTPGYVSFVVGAKIKIPPAAATGCATPASPAPIALGDMVMLGAKSALEQFGITVDAAPNRQPQDVIDELRTMGATGTIGNTVVIQVGTNGPVTDSELDQMVALLPQAVTPNVVFMTVHAPTAWIADNNARIRALPSRHQSVTVLDWDALSANTQLCSDGIHLTCNGGQAAQYFASVIHDALGTQVP